MDGERERAVRGINCRLGCLLLLWSGSGKTIRYVGHATGCTGRWRRRRMEVEQRGRKTASSRSEILHLICFGGNSEMQSHSAQSRKHPRFYLNKSKNQDLKTRMHLLLVLMRRLCSTKEGPPHRRSAARKCDLCFSGERETLFVKTFSGSLTPRFNVAILNLRSLSGGERSSLSIFAVLGRSVAEGVVQPICSQAVSL